MALRRGQRDSTAVDERGRKHGDARDPPRGPMNARETKSRTVERRRRAARRRPRARGGGAEAETRGRAPKARRSVAKHATREGREELDQATLGTSVDSNCLPRFRITSA
ncbi:hypothetical protein ERJ75_001543500 [Trypanosoma vivax]|nr:hypothetical protein ERJ75_001543900 [Trypanosoma vivax]KAH8606161.1 hypothetical protein ERJ75_001543500 [Trypanosoma vivax]